MIQCCNTAEQACDTTEQALRHTRQCVRHGTQCARGRGLGYDTILYRDRGELRQCAPAHAWAQRNNRGFLRHGRVGPVTRHSARADWAKGGCTVHSTQF